MMEPPCKGKKLSINSKSTTGLLERQQVERKDMIKLNKRTNSQ